MEPHTEQEDENTVSDKKVTPENVKTSHFSQDYKELIKLLTKLI